MTAVDAHPGMATTAPGSRPDLTKQHRRARWIRRSPLMPALIFAIIVTQIPFVITIIYSFTSWNLVRPGSFHFIGFSNYLDIFSDGVFLETALNTVILTLVSVFISLLLGLGFALLLHRRFIGRSFVRTMMITPFLIMPAAAALLWKTTMFNPTYGLLDFAAQPFGGGDFDWLSSFPLGSVMIQIIWQWTPFMMLLILAGLQSQSKEVLEAAEVDGANRWRTFISITLPLLSRYMQLAVLLGTIYIVNSFAAVYLMTHGGPGTASANLPFYIYQRAFEGFDVGESSAMGVIVALATLIVATGALRLIFRSFMGTGKDT